MKTSLFPMARSLCVLLLTAGPASAQVLLSGYWDSPPPGGGASPGMSYGGFDTSYRSPYSRVSDPASPAQMNPAMQTDSGTKWSGPQPAPPSHSVLSGTKVSSGPVSSGPEYAVRSGMGGGQWQLGADALYLTRVSGNSYPLLRIPSYAADDGYTHVTLDTADFDYDWQPGYRVTASRICTDGWGVEAAFFALGDAWRYDTIQTDLLELQGPGAPYFNEETEAPVSYHVWNETEFCSGELNVTRTICDWATCRAGVRYIRLNDTMQVDELTTPWPGLLVSTTTNDLIGPQIGCDLRLCDLFCGRLRINGSVNIGALYNHCEGDVNPSYFDVPPLTSEANEVALLGEASLTAKLRLTENIAVRGGYHILGLNGVALAPDQIGASDVYTEISRIRTGSLIAHGASLGLEVFW